RFDRVIIDSPPLGPVTDGVVLATRVDGTVFVVRAFETSKDVVRRALRSINNVKGTIIGTLLNGVSSTRPGYGGYGQSYYQYSDGYAPEAENEAA
ncbi:MAG: protein tyrosine kinase, partial [Polyangiaceae bacterium]